MFVVTLALIAASLLLAGSGDSVPQFIPAAIFAVSIVQFAAWYSFQLWLLRFYPERDAADVAVRAFLLPEFVYGSALTVTLMGAYAFHAVQLLLSFLPRSALFHNLRTKIEQVFSDFGYTKGWGTR